MTCMLFAVLITLACLNVCFADSVQESSSTTSDGELVDFFVIEHDVEPRNVSFNCTYSAKSKLFVNLTISKDEKVFYSYNSTTSNAPKFTIIDGIANITRKAPGVFVVENVTDAIEGRYSCNVYFNDTKTTDVSNINVNLRLHFLNESDVAEYVLKMINETVQGALKLSDQLHQLTKSKNETLKQEILNEIDEILMEYKDLPTESTLEEELKSVTMVEKYYNELLYANDRLVVKYANLAKAEVQKH